MSDALPVGRVLLWIALGGAAGSVLRYLVSLWLGRGAPYGTLLVNLTGSFLLALLLAAVPGGGAAQAQWRLALGTGVLGGFTTYSTFNVETLMLLQRGEAGRALLYIGATVLGALIAGWLGWTAGRWLAA